MKPILNSIAGSLYTGKQFRFVRFQCCVCKLVRVLIRCPLPDGRGSDAELPCATAYPSLRGKRCLLNTAISEDAE